MMKKVALILLGALVFALPAMAAGGEKGDWELGLFAGYGIPDDYELPAVEIEPESDYLYGVRFGYFLTPKFSLEGSWQQLSTETDDDVMAAMDADLDAIRLNALWNFRAGEKLRPFVTAGLGSESFDVDGAGPLDIDETDLGINVGGGLRWFFTDRFALRGDVRLVSIDVGGAIDDRQMNMETSLGVGWVFGGGKPGDSDGDGVLDRKDDCPDTPRGATVDEKGCPKDSDGDGVYDGLDKCPDTAKGVPVDGRGCALDSDGDGVNDGLDKCPDTPKGAKVDENGCPMDSDGDGVYDGLDRCPGTPKGVKVDRKGCPMDSDGDGVYDGLDKCPDTAKGVKVDEKGCPVLFEKERGTLVLEGVNFEFNSAELTSSSRNILDRVARTLKEWPEVRVEVAGHTDSVGSEKYNKDLSQKRAESVRAYLVSKGANAANLMARGYGEGSPITSNDTQEGRDQNRRVELKKLSN